jgi:phosphoribosyl-ATP pyrophosphohydrolase
MLTSEFASWDAIVIAILALAAFRGGHGRCDFHCVQYAVRVELLWVGGPLYVDISRDNSVAGCALARAWQVQRDAAAVGFDWPEIGGVFDKVHEEIDEIRHALANGEDAHAQEELGDLLFAVVNLARHLGAAPGAALDDTTQRFTQRFARVCDLVRAAGKSPEDCTLEELDHAWNTAKRESRGLVEKSP